MRDIVKEFSKLELKITDVEIRRMEELVIRFETRGSHLLALNSPYLAVHPIAFTDGDRDAFFQIFGVTAAKISAIIKHHIPAIRPSFKVASNPINVLGVWLLHLSFIYIQDTQMRERFMLNVAKFFHYAMFTSLVNWNFKYGANEAVMAATVRNLSRKYDLTIHGSWRVSIEERCKDIVSPKSIHYKTLKDGGDDEKFIYVISDIQTSLRNKINNFRNAYYETIESGEKITGTTLVKSDAEGEKILLNQVSVLDGIVTNVVSEVLNVHGFVDRPSVEKVASQFTAISANLLFNVLVRFSELASTQGSGRELDMTIKGHNGERIFVGVRALLTNLIQASYRYCIKQGVLPSDKALVFKTVKDAFSASRTSDPMIIDVKNSIKYFVDSLGKSPRESTVSSLRIALVMYTIYRSFSYV